MPRKQSGLFNEYYRLIYIMLVSFVTGALLLIAIMLIGEVKDNGGIAKVYGVVLAVLILLSIAALAGCIIRRLRKQHRLTIQQDISDRKTREAAFSIRGMMQLIQTLFAERVKSKGLSLQVIFDPILPDTMIGDATRLTQILVNLIGNALKYTENGEITVIVNGEHRTATSIRLRCYISDTGIGISKEKLPYIFEHFKQTQEAMLPDYGDPGLGLANVKDLVILQDGDITVDSEVGKGTTFSFSIPYHIADEPLFRYIHPAYIRGVSKGDRQYEKTVTGQFIALIPKRLIELREALQANDRHQLSLIAQDMKTSMAAMGVTGVVIELLNEVSGVPLNEMEKKIALIEEICTAAVREAVMFNETLAE